jgi:hypothetical protein
MELSCFLRPVNGQLIHSDHDRDHDPDPDPDRDRDHDPDPDPDRDHNRDRDPDPDRDPDRYFCLADRRIKPTFRGRRTR